MNPGRRGALATLAAAGATLGGCSKGTSPAAGPAWPELPVRDLAGTAGRIVPTSSAGRIVNFWALWCPPCRQELPGLERLAASLQPKGIQVSAVALAEDEFPVREYLRQYAARLPGVLMSPSSPLVRQLGLDSLPQTFFIAPEGSVLACWVGARDWDAPEVRAQMAGLLKT